MNHCLGGLRLLSVLALLFVVGCVGEVDLTGGLGSLRPGQAGAGGQGAEGACSPGNEETGVAPDFRCTGSALQYCNPEGTGWLFRQQCESAALCQVTDPATNQIRPICLGPSCQAGDFRCNPDNPAELQTCSEDQTGWVSLASCATAAHCNAEQQTCTAAPCNPGEIQCSGVEAQRCRDDQMGWDTIATCDTTSLCDQVTGGCNSAVCEADATRCDEAFFQRCSPGRDSWQNSALPCVNATLCDDDIGCIDPACAVNQYGCVSNLLMICNLERTGFVQVATCPTPAQCSAPPGMIGACNAEPCQPGRYECNGAELRQCNEDGTDFVTVADCLTPGLCQLSIEQERTTCADPVCNAGDEQCTGPVLQRCNDDRHRFDDLATCDSEELCLQSADTGTGVCQDPVCEPDQCRCTSSTTGQSLEQCKDGRNGFTVLEPCAQGCNAAACSCAGCEPGAFQCQNGSLLYRCDAESGFTFVDACASATLCSQAAQAASAACPEPRCSTGEYRCNESSGDLEVCSADRTAFVLARDCGPDETCDLPGRQCDACAPNAARCDGDTRVVCSSDGQGESRQNCGAGSCRSEGCLVCSPNTYSCSDNGLHRCNAAGSANDLVADCDPGRCDQPNTRCCTPSSFECSDGVLYQCGQASDVFVLNEVEDCGNLPCDPVAGQCGVCIPPSRTCQNSDVYACNANGTYQLATDCSGATPICATIQGEVRCAACTPGTSCGINRTCSDLGVCDCSVAGGDSPGDACCTSSQCDDGAACTSGACTVQGTQATCSFPTISGVCTTSNPCQTSTCDPASNSTDPSTGCALANRANGTTCNDSQFCTTSDSCTDGTCSGGANTCNDSNACTDDSCNEANDRCNNTTIASCCTSNANCSDGFSCTTDSCGTDNRCTFTAGTSCNDMQTCTDDSCNPTNPNHVASTGCVFTPDTGNTCDDGNVCTSNTCTAQGTCSASDISNCCIDDADCDDGDVCTTDTCTNNRCATSDIAGCCTDICLLPLTCQPNSECGCTTPGLACCTSAANCEDGNVCTTSTCTIATGVCSPQAPIAGCCTTNADCADNDPCTTSTCTIATGVCSPQAPITGCCITSVDCPDDTDLCTAAPTCDNNVCNAPERCADGEQCQCDDGAVCILGLCAPIPVQVPSLPIPTTLPLP